MEMTLRSVLEDACWALIAFASVNQNEVAREKKTAT